ncbi:MAG TPA: N-acetylmuramoyl-L-alanine amidase [Chitinophagaceae bacterium]|nr:N-acetylmuramoyl-L-alanine amidase [Chitinophagaceae bacterium]
MNFLSRISTSNFDKLIHPEFIILHYSGGSYNRIKHLFEKPDSVSAHFVIDLDGAVDNAVSYAASNCNRAWHAGKSEWEDHHQQRWEDLNSCSIGIELVNLNGNLFEYTAQQIDALIQLCHHLFDIYPNLNSPYKILGHEHIAGKRGKADPGILFPWKQFFHLLFGETSFPQRKPNCPPELADNYKKFLDCTVDETADPVLHHNFWHAVNFNMEKTIAMLYGC